jgi:hypothetical protein
VLAYHFLTWIRETLRRLLSTHSLVTTLMPLKDGRVLRSR